MEIREMDYSLQLGERYIVTDFTQKIYGLIKSSILSYTKLDIEKAKTDIIDDIIKNEKDLYMQEKLEYRYEPRIKNLTDLNKSDLENVIFNIKSRYINDEAIMQLINEGKLIPIDNIRPKATFLNGADILVDVKYDVGNTCLYFYLDILPISRFKVSRTIFN